MKTLQQKIWFWFSLAIELISRRHISYSQNQVVKVKVHVILEKTSNERTELKFLNSLTFPNIVNVIDSYFSLHQHKFWEMSDFVPLKWEWSIILHICVHVSKYWQVSFFPGAVESETSRPGILIPQEVWTPWKFWYKLLCMQWKCHVVHEVHIRNDKSLVHPSL